jgi:hypothetical protein
MQKRASKFGTGTNGMPRLLTNGEDFLASPGVLAVELLIKSEARFLSAPKNTGQPFVQSAPTGSAGNSSAWAHQNPRALFRLPKILA